MTKKKAKKKYPQRRPKKGKLHDLKTLTDDGRSKYTPDERREICLYYIACGSGAETARHFGIHEMTISRWKKRDWWVELTREANEMIEDKIRSKLNRITNKAADEAIDRLEHGDVIYDSKTGSQVRIPVKMMDAVKASAIAYDKRRISLNQPTKITTGDTDQLQRLADKFAEIAENTRYKKIRQEESIPGEFEEG